MSSDVADGAQPIWVKSSLPALGVEGRGQHLVARRGLGGPHEAGEGLHGFAVVLGIGDAVVDASHR